MKDSTFSQRWFDHIPVNTLPEMFDHYRLIRVPLEKLAAQSIPNEAKLFLAEIGLPKSTAPCLSFDDLANGLRHIWEVFGTPADWSQADRSGINNYFIIGSDGAGNPICVEQESGRIVLLDHEDWFETVEFVNSGVAQLAEFLLLFAQVEIRSDIMSEMEIVDAAAVAEGSHWWHELKAAAEM